MSNQPDQSYDQVKQRLDEILSEVGNQDISLDAALDLYEEAVKLGMNASQLIESQTVVEQDASSQNSEADKSGSVASD